MKIVCSKIADVQRKAFSIFSLYTNSLSKTNGILVILAQNLGATVKAGTQERGTERGTEVMWFHTGNYVESRSTVASQQLLRVTTQLSSVGPAAYP